MFVSDVYLVCNYWVLFICFTDKYIVYIYCIY